MANLKNTTVDDSGFLRLPVGDTAARPGSPNGRQIRFNTETGKLEQFRPGVGDWIAPNNTGVIATGGDSVYDIDAEGTTYRVHVFTSTGTSTFTVLQGGDVEYLIVAGGGGGNEEDRAGGGGGAGGLLSGKTTVFFQSYNISVGSGGNPNQNGNDSLALGLTAIGGGTGGKGPAGSANAANTPGTDGGSGGGAGAYGSNSVSGGIGLQPQSQSGGFGNNGGNGGPVSNPGWAAGGGGAGSPGQDGAISGIGGNGLNSFITGLKNFYAGGGGGGTIYSGQTQIGIGGLGGGGDGGVREFSRNGQPGLNNTGGGGGGRPYSGASNAGAGGSGIVVIRYPLRQENPVTAPGRDIRDGLVLDLDFAKPTVYSGSGSVVTDGRLNGVEGDLVNGPAFINPRTHRSAFEFDGSNDVIRLNEGSRLENQDAISIEMWLSVGDIGPKFVQFITNRGNGSDATITLAMGIDNRQVSRAWNPTGSDTMVAYVGTSNGSTSYTIGQKELFGTTNGDGQIHQIVGIANSANGLIKMYYDSVEVGNIGGTFTGPIYTNSANNYRIGNEYSPGNFSYGLKGGVAITKIYHRELSATEILQHYNLNRWRFGV